MVQRSGDAGFLGEAIQLCSKPGHASRGARFHLTKLLQVFLHLRPVGANSLRHARSCAFILKLPGKAEGPVSLWCEARDDKPASLNDFGECPLLRKACADRASRCARGEWTI